MGVSLMIGGAALGAAGSIKAGNDANAAYKMKAGIDAQNAQIATDQGEADVISLRKNIYKVTGAQVTANAASGLASTDIMDILAETNTQGELDVQRRRYDASLKATGLRMQADLERFYGKSAQTVGYLNAASSLLGAGSKVGGGSTIPKYGDTSSSPTPDTYGLRQGTVYG